jgi:mono/diheme cytochrome c family protein
MGKKTWLTNSPRRDVCILAIVVLGIAAACGFVLHQSTRQQPQSVEESAADAAHGRALFVQNCASCHGLKAQGMPHQGADLQTSRFIAAQTDSGLIKFIRTGRQPGDPDSVMGLQMPPKGGNMSLDDQRLADIVAYLRTVQKNVPSPATQPAAAISPTRAGE